MEQLISASGIQYGLIINPDGSLNTSISGNIVIGSVSASVDSIYIQSGANMTGSSWVYQKTDPWVISGTSTIEGSVYTTGSIEIKTSLPSIGSFTNMVLGSNAITNFEVIGSSRVIENFNDLGSSRVIENFGDLGSSRVIENLYAGSEVWQGERWGVSGTIEVSNRVAGSIVNMPGLVGSVAITNMGSVIQVTNPWIVSGTSTVAGSVIIKEVTPIDSSKNNGVGSLIYAGANIGSIIKNIGGTEYVKVLSYSGTNLVGIGSWVEL